ncbi:MAG TPA: KUP/HAK/KT family potassium transporter [Methylocella sp.]|nr:KUP/HAK/KT family potassium transporter [Methylocella sp.]
MQGSARKMQTHAPRQNVLIAGVSALGVVFGDIGTSPLYTLKTVLNLTGSEPQPGVVLGVLSLILWTLIIITTVKYVTFAMSIDNDGEGGILALMALIGIKKHQRPAIVAIGLFGAALIYGDGAITPAISVLSALEGLNIATPDIKTYVLPLAAAILLALFALQPLGTAWIGKGFGPIMLLWFLSITILGGFGILRHPAVFAAFDPRYGLNYLFAHGFASFLVLGGVFLCATGAEALYADMGHFGSRPIRLAWSLIVFPSLILNYAGQSAIVLAGAPTVENIFYRLCPEPLLIPFIILATVATIIASQSIITGAFSMTRQAIQLGWLPRLRIIQTSETGYGQIYVGIVNWLLMIVTIALTVTFGKSDNLAAAYGIAVSATMLMTSVLLFIAMREVWGWNIFLSGAIASIFLGVDVSFFSANLMKVAEGGYVPLLLAGMVYTAMYVWHRGAAAVAEAFRARPIPIDEFLESLEARSIPRVPGTAIFLTRTVEDTPPVVAWHVKHNKALQRYLFMLRVVVESIPWVAESKRLAITEVGPGAWRATAHYGFLETPNVPKLLEEASRQGCSIDLFEATYYVAREKVIARSDGEGLPRWQVALFAAMERNAMRVSDYFQLPRDDVVEIGRQVEI